MQFLTAQREVSTQKKKIVLGKNVIYGSQEILYLAGKVTSQFAVCIETSVCLMEAFPNKNKQSCCHETQDKHNDF